MHDVVEVLQEREPGEEMTVYPVIALPPFELGDDHVTVICASPNTPDTPVGTPGTVAGTTAPDATDAAPEPALFVAVTENV